MKIQEPNAKDAPPVNACPDVQPLASLAPYAETIPPPNATLYVEGDLARPAPPPLPVGITYAPMLSEEGKLRNVILSVRDISHFRTADEIKATFISIVSHELRTPVALIKGYASTLRRDDAKWDKHTSASALISASRL